MRLTREIDKDNRTTEFINRLLQVWEASVRATHHFLTEQDIQNIKQQGEAALYGIDTLVVAFEEDIPIGFMGILVISVLRPTNMMKPMNRAIRSRYYT